MSRYRAASDEGEARGRKAERPLNSDARGIFDVRQRDIASHKAGAT